MNKRYEITSKLFPNLIVYTSQGELLNEVLNSITEDEVNISFPEELDWAIVRKSWIVTEVDDGL